MIFIFHFIHVVEAHGGIANCAVVNDHLSLSHVIAQEIVDDRISVVR